MRDSDRMPFVDLVWLQAYGALYQVRSETLYYLHRQSTNVTSRRTNHAYDDLVPPSPRLREQERC